MAKKLNPTASKLAEATGTAEAVVAPETVTAKGGAMLFDKQNYRLMLIGLGLVLLGFILMRGGNMPDANVWDESLIYSFTRITLSPIVILAGLGIEVYAIFIKK
jgi:hypothetical protein